MVNFASELLEHAATAGAALSQGKKNDVAGCCDPPPEIVIALFFDGTGNNQAVDESLRRQDEEWNKLVRPHARGAVQKSRKAEQAAAQAEDEVRQRLEAARCEREIFQADVNDRFRAAHSAGERVRRARDKAAGGTPVESDQAAAEIPALQTAESKALAEYETAKTLLAAKDAEVKILTAEYEAARRERERCFRERQAQERNKANASPVTNGPSNIAKLLDLYPEDPANYIHSIYIEGVGTFDDARDPNDYDSLGQGFGLGKKGGRAKILKAKEQVIKVLRNFQGCKPKSITFDIFGFSRGAALARHFVNVILAGVPDLTHPKEEHVTGVYTPFGNLLREVEEGDITLDAPACAAAGRSPKAYVYKPLDAGIVKIRFVGLFDTVGSFYWGGNDDEGEFVLNLPQGCAKKVVHLVSRDERRKNFRGTSIFNITRATEGTVEQGEKKEITLGGVHSDIGGGYPIFTRSYHLMDYSNTFIDNGFGTSGLEEKEALLARAKKVKGIVAEDGTLTEKYCLIKKLERHTKNLEYYSWLLIRVKYTADDYANYCLEKMWKEASSEILLRDIPSQYKISEPLRTLFSDTNPNSEDELWESYFHVSAIDNEPFQRYSQRPLGYYLDEFFLKLGMKLDESPLGPRVMFPNTTK